MPRTTKRHKPSAKLKTKHRKLPQNSPPVSRGISAKLGPGQKTANRALTAFQETRGRKRRIHPENVVRAANDLFEILEFCKDQIDWGKLETVKTEKEASSAFERVPLPYRERLNLWLAAIPEWALEGKFPKANLERKMRHLADSIAAEGFLTPRRCRDVCYEERKRQAQLGMIFRREFYIECTCTYRGPAKGGGVLNAGQKGFHQRLNWKIQFSGNRRCGVPLPHFPVMAFGPSRPAADAAREVTER